MMRLKLVPSDTTIDFMKLRPAALVFSALLVLASIGIFLVSGLNLGIDFKGGILIEARSNAGPANVSGLRGGLEQLDLGDINLQEFGTETDILIRVQRQEGDEKAQIAAIEAITQSLGSDYEVRRTEFVGPTVGAELAEKGMLAVGCALLAIMLYRESFSVSEPASKTKMSVASPSNSVRCSKSRSVASGKFLFKMIVATRLIPHAPIGSSTCIDRSIF